MNLQPDKNITFHAFDVGGVLHRTGSHRLWVLNVTAATLWCLIDGQSDASGLARSYSERFGIDDPAARQDVTALLAQFSQWGLLIDDVPVPSKGDEVEQPLEPIQVEKRLTEDIAHLPRVVFRLADHGYAVTFSDPDMAEGWRTLFQHLICDEQPLDSCLKLVVLQDDTNDTRRFYCYENDLGTEERVAYNEVVPVLIYKLFEHRMAGLTHRLLFHAAVVGRGDQALLLPAQSGSGKSTLSAALSASGWNYLSDELALVDPATCSVEPFALPIGLKDKSMGALAPFIPHVTDLPRHIRVDGIGIRYFPPPKVLQKGSLSVKALVYPQYSQDESTRLTKLQPLDALTLLATTGSSARPLVEPDVQAMLQLASLPSYRLEFSDLGQAVKVLEEINTESY